jgi:hypothetical protein
LQLQPNAISVVRLTLSGAVCGQVLQDSKVFTPFNPMVAAILSLLAELVPKGPVYQQHPCREALLR